MEHRKLITHTKIDPATWYRNRIVIRCRGCKQQLFPVLRGAVILCPRCQCWNKTLHADSPAAQELQETE